MSFSKLTPEEARGILKDVNFKDGLVAAIAREAETKDVLMLAWMNEEAAEKTLTSGLMHYWSRSRDKLWLKGEKSKHYQRVQDMWVDCDGDVLLFDVEQERAACHEGYHSCFYRKLEGKKLSTVLEREFDPKEVYG